MKRIKRLGFPTTISAFLLLACAVVIAAWLASYHWAPQFAWTARNEKTHLTLRGGTLWLIRGGGPAAIAGARPVLVVKAFGNMIRRNQVAEDYLRTHAAFLRSRLGDNDPEAAAEVDRANALRSSIHDDVLAQIDGPRSQPIVAEVAPTLSTKFGLTFEQGIARFAARQPDGAIAYGDSPSAFSAVAIPCWMLAAALGLFPSLLTAHRLWRIHRARSNPGLCPTCGYDMRATPDRCPECGYATSSAQLQETA
jgi:hypothetical protein